MLGTERRVRKTRTSATVSGERRQKGVPLLPGLSYCLWEAICSYSLHAKKILPVFRYSRAQRTFFVCMCPNWKSK